MRIPASAARNEPQQPNTHGDGNRNDERNDFVPRHLDRAEVHKRIGAEELLELTRSARGRIPDPRGESLETKHDANGHDDLRDLRGATKILHDYLVESGTQKRSKNTQDHEQRKRCRPIPSPPELPVGKDRKHRYCTLREVENARGGVRDDETGRGDEIGATNSQTQDRVLQECLHSAPPRPVAETSSESLS